MLSCIHTPLLCFILCICVNGCASLPVSSLFHKQITQNGNHQYYNSSTNQRKSKHQHRNIPPDTSFSIFLHIFASRETVYGSFFLCSIGNVWGFHKKIPRSTSRSRASFHLFTFYDSSLYRNTTAEIGDTSIFSLLFATVYSDSSMLYPLSVVVMHVFITAPSRMPSLRTCRFNS